MKPLRIAFAGASGTGKTVLMNKVAERYALPINPVGSRHVAKLMGFDSPYDVDAVGLRPQFQHRLFSLKRQWEEEHDSFIADRSVLDNLCYTMLHCCDSLSPKELEAYYAAQRRYDFVFYLPLMQFQNLGDDPSRKKNPVYHVAFDMLLHSAIENVWEANVELYCPVELRFARVCEMVDAWVAA